jgi:hypothetical protein
MPRSVPLHPFYLVSIDLVGPLATTMRGFTYIMVVQDAFSKWIELIPLRDMRASSVADQFMKNIVARYGPPMKILTDRGSQFTAAIFSKMCSFLGVRNILTTSYRPQCNGANERTHRELRRYLGMFMGVDGSQTQFKVPWDTLIRYAAWAYNTSYHAVLHTSPYEVLFGRPPSVHALDALGGQHTIAERIVRMFSNDDSSTTASKPLSGDDAAIFRLIKLDKDKTLALRERVLQELEEAQQRWSKSPDVAEDGPNFLPGDYILLRNMRATSTTMLPKYLGPYEVLEKITPVNYKISRPDEPQFKNRNYTDTVHLDLMKLYHDPNPGEPILPLFLEPEEKINDAGQSVTVKLVEVTPAGLKTVVRLPADTQTPVPLVGRYIKNSFGQVEPDPAYMEGVAPEQPPGDIEQLAIQSAPIDPTPDPLQLHADQVGTVTRAKAAKIGWCVPNIYPFRQQHSDE